MTPLVRQLKGRRVTIDSMVFIYAFENHPIYVPLVRPILEALEKGEMEAVTSTLTLAECLVQPYKKKDAILAAQYRVLFHNFPNLFIYPLTEDTADKAAFLRAQYHLKIPDAIQLATAFAAGSRSFLTNDTNFPSIE